MSYIINLFLLPFIKIKSNYYEYNLPAHVNLLH
jgi:hypothetical protein